jgi:hypothetical protein
VHPTPCVVFARCTALALVARPCRLSSVGNRRCCTNCITRAFRDVVPTLWHSRSGSPGFSPEPSVDGRQVPSFLCPLIIHLLVVAALRQMTIFFDVL